MRGPLTVRINDGIVDRFVPRDRTSGLRFAKVANGGHHSASVRIGLPRDDFSRLGPADKIDISDGRTGRVLWSGYTENPGYLDGTSGQGFDLAAMGSMILASDEARSLVYIDRGLENWTQNKSAGAAASAEAGTGGDPAGVAPDGLLMQFPPGQPIGTNSAASLIYLPIEAAGMEFGALQLTVQSGKTDTGYRAELAWFVTGSSGSGPLGSSSQISTTPSIVSPRFVNDANSPPDGFTRFVLRLRRSGGATTVADDNTWTLFNDLSILGRRMDRYGTLLTSSTGMVSASYVLSSWVVEDLLGRVLTTCDPVTATVDTTTYQIDQLAFTEATRASEILDRLVELEPDFYWGVGERLLNGKHRFWFRAWPTTARYEISTRDGYSAPGADSDLCNRIAISWTDKSGIQQTTVRTATVEELGSRIRDADAVTLPDGVGSQANAEQIGDQILASKADPPKAAKANVTRPILDLDRGGSVMPWEIEPGHLVRVRETGDLLRLTEVEYNDDDCSATLTLGEPVLTIDQRVARMAGRIA